MAGVANHDAAAADELFVGRTRQLRQVDAVHEALVRGRRSLVMVTGEAGIGKTWFLREVARRACARGCRTVTVRCWPDGGAPPLWPWPAILAQLSGSNTLGQLTADLHDEPRQDRFSHLLAVSERVNRACADGPVCLVIDDVNHTEGAALRLVRFAADSAADLPLGIVLSRRSGNPTGEESRTQLLDAVERDALLVRLGGFDHDETVELLCRWGVDAADIEMSSLLHELTRGNPLFLRRIVEARRAIGTNAGLPDTIRIALDQSIGRMSPRVRQVVTQAAVLGMAPQVAEVAAVAGCTTATVLDAVGEAARMGLLVTRGPGRFAFGHELMRKIAEEQLDPATRLDAHARAAALLAAADAKVSHSDRMPRAAYHARLAAARSTDDAQRAISLCYDAATEMMRGIAYEHADALLGDAVALHEPLGREPRAGLLLAWARAVDMRGHRSAAQVRYLAAAERADTDGDPVRLAESALGLGGVRLDEHPMPHHKARMVGLLHRAIAALPIGAAHETLRRRLIVRIAAQEVFDGGDDTRLTEAVDALRRTGDVGALAEGLATAHQAVLRPEQSHMRLAMADDVVQMASMAGRPNLVLFGLLWRTVDLLRLGDPQALRAVEVLRERATAIGNDDIKYHVALLDVLVPMRRGRLDQAESAAWICCELGEAIERTDPRSCLAWQLAVIRWMQGRDAELLDDVAQLTTSPGSGHDDFAAHAMAACLAARAGQAEMARALLAGALPDRLADLPPSSTWLAGMVALVEAAAALGDAGLARQAYAELAPFAGLPAIVGLGIASLGSTERALGLAAATFGNHGGAVTHLERALAANLRLGHRPMSAITRGDLAQALARQGGDDGRQRRAELLGQALAEGKSMGLEDRVAVWEAERLGLRAGGQAGAAPAIESSGRRQPRQGLICQDGKGWVVELQDRSARVGNLVGMTYLAELLVHPGVEISAATLAGGGPSDVPTDLGGTGLDDGTRARYAERAWELADDLAEADAANDLVRAERLRAQLGVLVDEVEAKSGLTGRALDDAGADVSTRTSVAKAVKRALATIHQADPIIGNELRDTVSTGTSCCYTPKRDPIVWATAHT